MWEVALVILVLVISVTCIFVIRTLILLQRSLLKLDRLSEEGTSTLRNLEMKATSLDSIFRSISNLGDICESKTFQMKEHYLQKPSFREEKPNVGEDVINLALTSARLYQQIFKKRG